MKETAHHGSESHSGWRLSHPGDAAEREADRVADAIAEGRAATIAVTSPPQLLSRAGDDADDLLEEAEEQEEEDELEGEGVVSRSAEGHADASAGVDPIPPGPGAPLDPLTRTTAERALGRDLSAVRVHTDGVAARNASALGARAYTVGQDIVFGAGRFAPGTPQGGRLLLHEIAHTVQHGARRELIHREEDPAAALSRDEIYDRLLRIRMREEQRQRSLPAGGFRPQRRQLTRLIAQVYDRDGRLLGTHYTRNVPGSYHAEDRLAEVLRSTYSAQQLSGGRVVMVVTRRVCPRCTGRLSRFANDFGVRFEPHYVIRKSQQGVRLDVGLVRRRRETTAGTTFDAPVTSSARRWVVGPVIGPGTPPAAAPAQAPALAVPAAAVAPVAAPAAPGVSQPAVQPAGAAAARTGPRPGTRAVVGVADNRRPFVGGPSGRGSAAGAAVELGAGALSALLRKLHQSYVEGPQLETVRARLIQARQDNPGMWICARLRFNVVESGGQRNLVGSVIGVGADRREAAQDAFRQQIHEPLLVAAPTEAQRVEYDNEFLEPVPGAAARSVPLRVVPPFEPTGARVTFAPGRAIVQRVMWGSVLGFRDRGSLSVNVPAGAVPDLLPLRVPGRIVAGTGTRDVDVGTDARTGLPTLGLRSGLFGRTWVVCVFPADGATRDLLDVQAAALEDELSALRAYDNEFSLGLARFVRPENLEVL